MIRTEPFPDANTCDQCGAERSPHWLENGRRVFCSGDCQQAFSATRDRQAKNTLSAATRPLSRDDSVRCTCCNMVWDGSELLTRGFSGRNPARGALMEATVMNCPGCGTVLSSDPGGITRHAELVEQ